MTIDWSPHTYVCAGFFHRPLRKSTTFNQERKIGFRKLAPVICSSEPSTTASGYKIMKGEYAFLSGIVSITFLVMTVIFYIVRPKLRNLQGKCIICCLTSMTIGNTILFAVTIKFPEEEMCHTMGFIAYLFYECSFSWLSIIGYDMWRNSKTFIAILNERKRFLNYSEFGWGIPMVLLTIVIAIRKSDVGDPYKPLMDDYYCWWSYSKWSTMYYYFGPIAAILLVNFTFCALILWKELPNLRKSADLRQYTNAVQNNLSQYSLLLSIIAILSSFNIFIYLDEVLQLNSNNIILCIAESVNIAEGPLIFYSLVILSIMKIKRRRPGGDEFESQFAENCRIGSVARNQSIDKDDPTRESLLPQLIITSQIK